MAREKKIEVKQADGTTIFIPVSEQERKDLLSNLVYSKPSSKNRKESKKLLATHQEFMVATKTNKLASIVRNYFADVEEFTAKQVEEWYNTLMKNDSTPEGRITQSTASTYLKRLTDGDYLERFHRKVGDPYFYSKTNKLLNDYAVLDIESIPIELFER